MRQTAVSFPVRQEDDGLLDPQFSLESIRHARVSWHRVREERWQLVRLFAYGFRGLSLIRIPFVWVSVCRYGSCVVSCFSNHMYSVRSTRSGWKHCRLQLID